MKKKKEEDDLKDAEKELSRIQRQIGNGSNLSKSDYHQRFQRSPVQASVSSGKDIIRSLLKRNKEKEETKFTSEPSIGQWETVQSSSSRLRDRIRDRDGDEESVLLLPSASSNTKLHSSEPNTNPGKTEQIYASSHKDWKQKQITSVDIEKLLDDDDDAENSSKEKPKASFKKRGKKKQ